jgi:amphi-Trp domain-containing protein
MGRKNVLVKSKERRSIEDVAEFLHQLADRLVENELVVQQGAGPTGPTEEVTVTVPNQVTMKLKIKEKLKKRKTKHSLKLGLKWVEHDTPRGTLKLG